MSAETTLLILSQLCKAGQVPCSDRPLHISFNRATEELILGEVGPLRHQVVFPQARFVEMVQRSTVPPTDAFIRAWLCTIYYDPESCAWARTVEG